MIHLMIDNKKVKCGSRPWGRFAFQFRTTTDKDKVDCKRCLGQVKRTVTFEPIDKDMVGTIFHTSWGYDMTHNEYVKVVKQTEKALIVRELYAVQNGQDDGRGNGKQWAGGIKPDGKEFKIFRKVRRYTDYKGQPQMFETWRGSLHQCAGSWSIWDGKPDYYNTWD